MHKKKCPKTTRCGNTANKDPKSGFKLRSHRIVGSQTSRGEKDSDRYKKPVISTNLKR
jgi:hypothetical protein